MTTSGTPLVAVICEDDVVVATALAHTLRDLYGMRVAATVRTAAAAWSPSPPSSPTSS